MNIEMTRIFRSQAKTGVEETRRMLVDRWTIRTGTGDKLFRSRLPFIRVPRYSKFLIIDEISSVYCSSFLSTGVFTNVIDMSSLWMSLSRVSSVDRKLRKLIVIEEVRESRAIDTFARKSINYVFYDRSSTRMRSSHNNASIVLWYIFDRFSRFSLYFQ